MRRMRVWVIVHCIQAACFEEEGMHRQAIGGGLTSLVKECTSWMQGLTIRVWLLFSVGSTIPSTRLALLNASLAATCVSST